MTVSKKMNKAEVCELLSIQLEELELGMLQTGLDPEQEILLESQIQAIADLFGIVIESKKQLQSAVDSGALTVAEANGIVQNRVKAAGYSLTTSEINYLFETTAVSFRALGKSLAQVASENYQDGFNEEKARLLENTQVSLEQFAIAIKANAKAYTPATTPQINFDKLSKETAGLFND